MSDPSQSMAAGGLSLATSTGFMVAAALVGFILFLFVFALYLHAKRCYGADPVTARGRSARRLVFASESSASPEQQRGLDAAAIEALPSVVFRRAAGSEEGGAECAVCLCELADGEAARVLPQCGHLFHRECIDMWLFSHTTCPLCRTPAAAPAQEKPGATTADPGVGGGVESSVSSLRRQQVEMAIEIPTDLQAAAEEEEEEDRVMSSSTAGAAAVAIRSLRRMLSRGSGRAGGASPWDGGDAEQGRPAAAKTPTSSR